MAESRMEISSILQGKTPLNVDSGQTSQQTKATRYVEALYEAKCNAKWNSVPELARKVEKHSPLRKCLILASRAGARIYSNPSSDNFKSTLQEFGSDLTEAVQNEDSNPGDMLDAAVCHSILLFGAGRPQDVSTQLPEPLHRIAPASGGQGVEAWLATCVLQGTLVLGLAAEARQKHQEATTIYRSIISYLSHTVSLPNQCPELRHWSEELLCHICLYFSSDGFLGEAMASFHLLSKYLDGQAWKPLSPRGTLTRHSPRTIWRSYYETLSKTISEDLVYHPSPGYRDHNTIDHRGLLDDDEFLTSRVQQRAELKRVEANYETLLLKETQFPRANQVNPEVSTWIELVMSNWSILCGNTWTDQELGPGGKQVVARNTLDILYRAQTKTFHSTQILRYLFAVHEFLAEFDTAFKAFDTYVEIMNKGKARAEKSGLPGITLDDDETAARFASEAICVACSLGPDSVADKAFAIGETLQQWAKQNLSLGPEALSITARAIGISQAHLARSTPVPTLRADLHQKALEHLGRSVEDGPEFDASMESFYALSMLFAETRDIPNAVRTAKQALKISGDLVGSGAPNGVSQNQQSLGSASTQRSRIDVLLKQLPLWHLMVQLLCCREEFEKAQTCCNLALDEIGSVAGILPKGNRLSATYTASNNAAVNISAIGYLEKRGILEMKMTQLALVEIIEGPDAAVNRSNELLSLFSTLIGPVDFKSARKSQSSAFLSPPKSSSGTIRSVLGRPKSMRRTVLVESYHAGLPSKTASATTTRPNTSAAATPSIQVNNPTGQITPASADHEPPGLKPRHNTLKKKTSSIRRPDTMQGQPTTNETSEKDGANSTDQSEKPHNRVSFHDQTEEKGGAPPSSAQPLGHIPSNFTPDKKLPPPGHLVQPPQQDTRLPTPHPKDKLLSLAPLFIELHSMKQKASLLIKIWLFIARLYTNISLPNDAKEAVEEARRLVTALQEELSQEKASIAQFQERGWGVGKSIEELWADVHTEDGKILQSQSLPHDAMSCFEKALSHQPDHLEATIALSEILLDIFCQDIPLEKNDISRDLLTLALDPSSIPKVNHLSNGTSPLRNLTPQAGQDSDPSELTRLASRDRAYGLLSSITKLGVGWDSPEAWYVLSRAYEVSGQVEKAKEALWWTVRLEDTKPVRHWRNITPCGYVL